jgi:hypothetical protein
VHDGLRPEIFDRARLPLCVIGDDVRLPLGEIREVDLLQRKNPRLRKSEQRDVELAPFGVLLDEDRCLEQIEQLVDALPQRCFVVHDRLGPDARRSVLLRRFDDKRER